MFDTKKIFLNIINSISSSSPSASNLHQNKKTTSIVITLFLLSSFFSLIYFQNFNINNNHYANAASSLSESLQNNQQDLQSAINKQLQQSFTNTIKSINNDKGVNASQVNINTTNSKNIQNNILITNILAKNLENHIQKAGAILNITSKLPQVRNLSFAHLLSQTLKTLHGIPQGADVEKRQIAKNIIASDRDLYEVFFTMPNGDIYLLEPYSVQHTFTGANIASRDWFQETIRIHDLYLGNVHTTLAASGINLAVIGVPLYSLKDNSTIVGVWAGGIDFNVLSKELQSLNITTMGDNARIVYADHNGQKIADSDINKSKIHESFANFTSFKNAINGQSGSTMDIINNTKMLVTYQPVKVFHNTWVVLLMQPTNKIVN